MAFGHGKDSVFKIDNSGGTLTDISANVDGVNGFGDAVDSHDTTVYGSTDHRRIAGLKDGTPTVTGFWDATIDAHLHSILGTIVTAQQSPAGTGSGAVYYQGEHLVKSYTIDDPAASPVKWTLSLERDGALTRATHP